MPHLSVKLKYLRVAHEYMHSMFGVLFIFTLRLKDELLEDVIISGDDTERIYVSIVQVPND
jgi:hypothetical protein